MRFLSRVPSVSAIVFIALLGARAEASAIVTNGGFETGNFSGWTVSGFDAPCSPNDQFCGVSTATDPNYPIAVNSGTYAAYLGPVGSTTTLSQTLGLAPSTSYTLTFSLDEFISPDPSNGYTNSVAVAGNGTTLLTLSNMNDTGGYQPYSLNFSTAASGNSDLLSFTFQNDVGYFYLDSVDVEVASSSPAAPEPATWTLLMLSLAMAALLKRVRAASR